MKPLKTKDGLHFWVLDHEDEKPPSGNDKYYLSALTEEQAEPLAIETWNENYCYMPIDALPIVFKAIDQALKENGYVLEGAFTGVEAIPPERIIIQL